MTIDQSYPAKQKILRGFTLVELLVVIAIIAVLASLLLPALARARSQGQSARCIANLHQLGIAMCLYTDNDPMGRLPPDPAAVKRFYMPGIPGMIPPSTNTWIEFINPYLAHADRVRICPGDKFGEARLTIGRSSYVVNAYCATAPGELDDGHSVQPPPGLFGPLIGGPVNSGPWYSHPANPWIGTYKRPADTFLTFEASNLSAEQVGNLRYSDDHTHPSTWEAGWNFVTADIDPNRHGRTANYLFADFHVVRVDGDKLRRRIETGDNFSVIPQ